MTKCKQVKLSKMYRDGAFVGYGLSVDGQLLSNQLELRIEPSTKRKPSPRIEVVFGSNTEMMDDAPDIHLE